MKKVKLLAALMSAAVMATTTIMGASAAHYKGDIDRNDSVTISDVVSIQKHLSGKSSIDKNKLIYADMNDDNKINVFDLILAKRVVLGNAPNEEVPSLTTPAVTTTVTTTTTTTTTTTPATTQSTTTTTTEAATTQLTTTTTTEAATTQSTTTTTTEAETTQTTTTTTTEAATTQLTTTTTTEAETTQSTTTTTTEAETTQSTTTTTTEVETTQSTTTTTTEAATTQTTTTTTTEAATTQTTTTTTTESETTQSTTATEEITTTVSTETETIQTGVAGTDVNRGALIIYGDNSLSIDREYYADLTDATGISVPEITGNGTYTARFELSESNVITWLELRLLGASGTYINSFAYPNLNITIEGFKADGVETTKALDTVSLSLNNWEGASVNLINLLESTTVNESIEVTFTVTGLE